MSEGATEEVTIRLPIRFVPRKDGNLTRFVLSVVALIFGLYGLSWRVGKARNASEAGILDFVLLIIVMCLVVLVVLGFIGCLVKLLPGSPWFHLAVDTKGVAIAHGWFPRSLAWSDISPFAVATRILKDDGENRRGYLVVALRAEDADLLSEESQRDKRAVVRIDVAEYGGGEALPQVLANWLNEVRCAALQDGLRDVTVPPELRAAVLSSSGKA